MRQGWIRQHAAPDFQAQARWQRNREDRMGTTPSEDCQTVRLSDCQTALVALFGHVQRMEYSFHDAGSCEAT